MLATSTALVIVGMVTGYLLTRWRRKPPDPRATYLREQATRLFLAQHWARGGVMSGAHEAWQPCMTALGLAALVLRDETEISELLRELADAARDDPQLANIWVQARGELAGARRRAWQPLDRLNDIEHEHEIRVTIGKAPDGSPDWKHPELGIRTREMLVSACLCARKLLLRGHDPNAPPAAPATENS